MPKILLPSGVVARIALAGNRDYAHIKNNSSATIYVNYDGSFARYTAPSTDDTTDYAAFIDQSFPLAPGETLFLDNDNSRNVFNKEIWAAGTADDIEREIRTQGLLMVLDLPA